MSVEQLIALEAAQAELGTLYAVARSFRALQARAEADLLPRVAGLGSRLRGQLRKAQLTDDEVDAAAREVLSIRTTWQAALEQVRASADYQQALAALAADRQADLAELIPKVFADLRLVRPAPSLYFAVSPSSHRRRSGASPFLSAPECADRILGILEEGYQPEGGGTEWWDCELPSISCTDIAAAVDTPIALRLAAADVRVAVFAAGDEPTYRIFTSQLRAPMAIVLAAEATDEWWEAYEDSYRDFRDALQHELKTRGHAAAVLDTWHQ
jgi:hypothetical protein